jgi:hypothetical protein
MADTNGDTMSDVLVLRFRDLVTELGGTITEHRMIVAARGYVWWGWWMRQWETPPSDVFASIYEGITAGTEPAAFLLDSGQAQLHGCRISDIRVAPAGDTIGPPELDAAPFYYQRGSYPAWFKLTRIEPEGQRDVPDGWTFAAFPSNPQAEGNGDLVGRPVESLDQMRKTDATLWLVDAS